MEFFYSKKISIILIIALVLNISSAPVFAVKTLWPSKINLYNDNFNLDDYIATTCTASNSKKGFLFTGDPKEIFTLGAGHIAINMTLSGKGHVVVQYLEGLKKRGVKITLILINDNPPVGTDPTKAPKGFNNPYCYMIDFEANNGEWQRYNFERILDEYAPYIDNWVIGNEINSQLYGYFGPATVDLYTQRYCQTFKEIYKKIKSKNEDADVYISFDQSWNLPTLNQNDRRYDKELSLYKYNAMTQLSLINNYLDSGIDWGVSLHPYPSPLESAIFWDDENAGFDYDATDENEQPWLITLKNFEVAIEYLSRPKFLKKDKSVRNIIISEVSLTSHDGDLIQAAGLYYLWEKVRDNPLIKAIHYNAQNDVEDGYHFGLTSDKKKKRLAWAVFKDMDRPNECGWCKDLLDNILDQFGYVDENGILKKKEENEQK